MGIFDPKPFLEIEDAEWLRFFEVNVLSGVRLSRVTVRPDPLFRPPSRSAEIA
jgi:NAD(P)-dependent dehydrogenase (short-subunit alcohol dehydrogenase family)